MKLTMKDNIKNHDKDYKVIMIDGKHVGGIARTSNERWVLLDSNEIRISHMLYYRPSDALKAFASWWVTK